MVTSQITNASNTNAVLASTISIAGNETDLFPLNGGSSEANVNRLGGFGSDLFYDFRQNIYYALVDRGPGGGLIAYQTRVEKFSITTDSTTGAITSYQLLETIPFTIAAGTTFNGVTYDAPTSFNGLNSKLLNNDGSVLGLSQDAEGFVVGENGNFFVSDEYGPSIYEFSSTGIFVRAFTPPSNVVAKANGSPYYAADNSPATATGRQSDRGYEGLAISPDGTKLYAMLQDPLQEEGSGGSNPGRNSRNVRIIRYDVATGTSDAQYIYQLEPISDINNRISGTVNDFSGSAQGRSISISALVSINSTELLVLERDNRGVGIDDPTGQNPIGSKRIFKIDLTGATDVTNISLAGTNTLPANITPVNKTLFLDIAEAIQGAGQTVPEKFEGLALGPRLNDGTFALILATDNDFSVTQVGAGQQLDFYTNGISTVQVAIGSPAPTAPPGQPDYTLLPSYFYSFKTQVNALNVVRNVITGDAGDNSLIGTNDADEIRGLAGNDILNGAAGDDTLIGSTGNDTYIVDSAGDVVTEAAGEGNDLVRSSVTYTLGANVERLVLTGTTAIDGTGNGLSNVLIGNSAANTLTGGAGADTLDGKAGADTLIGGAGNDTYTVDNSSDIVTENAGEGNDLVRSSVDYTLSDNIERLTLTGTADIDGTGNGLNNEIIGNSGDNLLSGGAGNDKLTGGSGNDTLAGDLGRDNLLGGAGEDQFLIQRSLGFDILLDFKSGEDKIVVDSSEFGGITAPLETTQFRVGVRATTAEQRFIYNQGSGNLLYDADGNGSGAAVVIARLTTLPTLTFSDILVDPS